MSKQSREFNRFQTLISKINELQGNCLNLKQEIIGHVSPSSYVFYTNIYAVFLALLGVAVGFSLKMNTYR